MRRVTTLALIAGGTLAVFAGGAFARIRLRARGSAIPKPVTGIFPNGMAYARVGTGPKTLLCIQGGGVPTGLPLALAPLTFRPFIESGYTVWIAAQKQNLPKGYTVANMADDYAQVIADGFHGQVDLVLGESTGGMIAFSLAARHPDRFGHVAIAVAGYEGSELGMGANLEFARLLSEGRRAEAFAVLVRFLYPDLRVPGVARVAGAVMGRLFFADTNPYLAGDVMVRAEALAAFNAREILPDISVPVLLIGGDRDRFFPKEVYEETARLIPDCTLKLYEGKGHRGVESDKRLPRDVLEWVGERSQPKRERDAGQPSVIDQATAATDHIREEGRVEAPVAHVWAFLCDTSRWHDWDPRSEYSDFSGPVDQVGTTFVETSRLMAWDMKAHHTVVEVEPQRLLHHRSDKGFDIFFRLEPDGDATRLIVDCDYQLPGHLPGFVKDLLSRGLVERTMRETGEKFRALAEATVPAPA